MTEKSNSHCEARGTKHLYEVFVFVLKLFFFFFFVENQKIKNLTKTVVTLGKTLTKSGMHGPKRISETLKGHKKTFISVK